MNVPVLPPPQQGADFLEMNDLLQAPDLDLNAPPENDLGGIEDLLEIAENMDDQPFVGLQLEDVIIEDAHSDAGSENNVQAVDSIVDVEVFIPLEQINPDEIHTDELMDDHELEAQAAEEANQTENQIQLGFGQLFEPEADPVFSNLAAHYKPNAEAVKL